MGECDIDIPFVVDQSTDIYYLASFGFVCYTKGLLWWALGAVLICGYRDTKLSAVWQYVHATEQRSRITLGARKLPSPEFLAGFSVGHLFPLVKRAFNPIRVDAYSCDSRATIAPMGLSCQDVIIEVHRIHGWRFSSSNPHSTSQYNESCHQDGHFLVDTDLTFPCLWPMSAVSPATQPDHGVLVVWLWRSLGYLNLLEYLALSFLFGNSIASGNSMEVPIKLFLIKKT